MDTYAHPTRHRMLGLLAVLLALSQTAPAQAQAPEQVLRGMFDAARQQRSREKPAPANQGVTAADMLGTPPIAAAAVDGPVAWPSRQAFLDATRAGEFALFRRASEVDLKKIIASVQRILAVEYKVPAISRDCYEIGGFPGDVSSLLGDIAEVNVMTLSDQPPEFTNSGANRDYFVKSINTRLARLQNPTDPTHCDSQAMGRVVPHPYKAALVSLASEYAKATQVFVEEERTRRKRGYQDGMARQQQEEHQRQAANRAAEQQRIDAESTRIRADEQRRAQKEKARVGG